VFRIITPAARLNIADSPAILPLGDLVRARSQQA
jgi:hypothetical protein